MATGGARHRLTYVARAALGAAVVFVAGGAHGVRGQPAPTSFPAFVEPYKAASVEILSFPTLNARGERLRPTRWRVISGTGNDRENYVVGTQKGMLVDFGGEWVRFSEDEGRTWSEVLPDPALRSQYSYEGAAAVAPGGDVVAIGQDYPPMPGGALTFKYDASAGEWHYSTAKVHAPGLDRPAVAVIPGPFDIGGQDVPYISVLRGGFFAKSPWYYSLDGLNYVVPNSRTATSARPPLQPPFDIARWRELDWLQPHELIGVTPLGRGSALAEQAAWGTFDFDTRAPRSVFDRQTLTWAPVDLGEKGPEDAETLEPLPIPRGRTLADSRGTLHHVSLRPESIRYLISRDGGKSWGERVFPLLEGHTVPESTEWYKAFRVDGRRGRSYLSVHAIVDDDPLETQDLLYEFSVGKRLPKVKKIYVLGTGGYSCLLGGVASSSRADGICDFFNVTLLPDGRPVTSFTDDAHQEPALAVRID